jgi:transposase
MDVKELRAEAGRLKKVEAAHREVYRTLSQVTGSAMLAARAEQFRCNWEQILEARSRLLDAALRCLGELELANRKACDQAAELAAKHQRLLLQFQQQLGVVPKSMETDKRCQTQERAAEPAVSPRAEKPPARKRGAPLGHTGASRTPPRPEQVTETRMIPPPPACPCGCRQVQPLEEFDDLYLEDIPPVLRFYTRLRHQRGRCTACGANLRHQAAVAGPPIVIGPNLSILLTVMRQAGLTYRKLASLSTDLFEIPLTPAGVLGIVSRNAELLRPIYQQIQTSLRQEEVLHIDETGWKINFSTAYIWCLCNPRLAWFHPNPSRAAQVVKTVLGEDFPGTVVCDFYGAYNFFPNLQRCLVHFLRDLYLERKILPGSIELERFEVAVKAMIEHGCLIRTLNPGTEKKKHLEELNRELEAITRMKVPKGRPQTLRARLHKHRHELLTFARTPGVEYHNNRAERQVRPTVVNRKNSFGSASPTGAEHTCILNSVVETCRLNRKKPVSFIRKVIESATHTLPSIFDSPNTS